MVAHGVPLVEIGQLLRHRSPVSTANYARVDVDRLTELARPWPARREGTL
jgi:integrase/recombinase XerD